MYENNVVDAMPHHHHHPHQYHGGKDSLNVFTLTKHGFPLITDTEVAPNAIIPIDTTHINTEVSYDRIKRHVLISLKSFENIKTTSENYTTIIGAITEKITKLLTVLDVQTQRLNARLHYRIWRGDMAIYTNVVNIPIVGPKEYFVKLSPDVVNNRSENIYFSRASAIQSMNITVDGYGQPLYIEFTHVDISTSNVRQHRDLNPAGDFGCDCTEDHHEHHHNQAPYRHGPFPPKPFNKYYQYVRDGKHIALDSMLIENEVKHTYEDMLFSSELPLEKFEVESGDQIAIHFKLWQNDFAVTDNTQQIGLLLGALDDGTGLSILERVDILTKEILSVKSDNVNIHALIDSIQADLGSIMNGEFLKQFKLNPIDEQSVIDYVLD